MLVVAVLAITMVVVTMLPVTVPISLVPAFVVLALAVARNVLVLVPVVVDEVDGTAAGVVLAAVLPPVLFVSRRNVQMDRRDIRVFRHAPDHDRPRIDELRLLAA